MCEELTEMNFQFRQLLAQALSEWPEAIDLRLANSTSDLRRYAVDGLGYLADSISDAYIGHEQEVIYRNLHWAIHIEIHALARYTTSLILSNLRTDSVRIRFESILNEIRGKCDEWPESAQRLIESYFCQAGDN